MVGIAGSEAEGAETNLGGSSPAPPVQKLGNDSRSSTIWQSLRTGLQGIADTLAAETRRVARQLSKGKSADGAAESELIHELRVHMRRWWALSDLLPRKDLQRMLPRNVRRELAWAMQPLSRARDWDVLVVEILPRLCEEEPDLDREAAIKRAAARSAVVHGEMYEHLRADRFQCVLQLLRERGEDMRASMATNSPKVAIRRLRRKLERWDELVRSCLAGGAWLCDGRAQHRMRIQVKRLRYASEGILKIFPSRKLKRYAHSLGELQRALGSIQDLRIAAQFAPDVCVSLSSGKLAGRKAQKVCSRLLCEANAELRVARKRFLRLPAFWEKKGGGKFVCRLA